MARLANEGIRWLHLTGITPALSVDARAATERAIELAAAAGMTISLDINLRRRLWSDETAAPVVRALAARVDVILGSPDELAVLTHLTADHDPIELARAALHLGPSVAVVKLGAAGAVAVDRDAPDEADRAAGAATPRHRRPGRGGRRVLCRLHRRPTRWRRTGHCARDGERVRGRSRLGDRRPDRTPRPSRAGSDAARRRPRAQSRHHPVTVAYEPEALTDALIEAEPWAASRRAEVRRRSRPGPGQPDRRAHRLQRGPRPPRRDRPRDPDRLPPDRRPAGRAHAPRWWRTRRLRSGRAARQGGHVAGLRRGHGLGAHRGRPAADRLARGHRLDPATQRRPLVFGGDRAGRGLGAARRRGPRAWTRSGWPASASVPRTATSASRAG